MSKIMAQIAKKTDTSVDTGDIDYDDGKFSVRVRSLVHEYDFYIQVDFK